METIKQLTIDLPGIRDTILRYNNRGMVKNTLQQLESALMKKDTASLLYCLDELKNWYESNMNAIQANDFVHNKEAHVLCLRKVQFYAKELKDFEFPSDYEPPAEVAEQKQPLIFISHKSDDKKYGDALERLLIGLGVHNEQLIYTSHPLHKIPLDANIYDYLRQNIHRNVFLIILWSNEYLDSPACLNEMGAAWVVQCDYSNLYVPTFNFKNPKYHECAVDTRKMGAKLNGDDHCKQSMIELKNKVIKLFDLTDNEANSTHYLDQFMKEISEAK
jgi:hypothetical protein